MSESTLDWIDLQRGKPSDDDVSSLEISGNHPQSLVVTGGLPHGIEIAPRNAAAAHKLISWLEHWLVTNDGIEDGRDE